MKAGIPAKFAIVQVLIAATIFLLYYHYHDDPQIDAEALGLLIVGLPLIFFAFLRAPRRRDG